VLVRALMATRQLQAADTQMHAAIGLMRGGVTPSRHAYGLLWAAKLARARGDLSAATRLIGEAEDLLCAFEDAGTLSGLLRDVLRYRADAPATTRPRPGALTEAELAILRLMRGSDSQRDRPSALDLDQHRQDPPRLYLPQAGRQLPPRRRRARR
jgi:hypothetical protein